MTQKIFISYRRDDSADVTGRIYDRLVAHFGKDNIFKDVDSIPFGVDFKEHLTDAVQQCAIQLVVIGRDWLNITDGNGRRRLDDPRDFVRIEVEAALTRKIPVIPLLVMNAGMPDESHLPPTLAGLVYRNGTAIRRDPDFHNDMTRLINGLVAHFDKTPAKPAPITPSFTLPLLEWISIPAGSVTLETKPPQTYQVAAFQIAKYPVTHAQFQAFINDGGYIVERWWQGLAKRETKPEEARWPIANHPRERVNWYEAVAFTRWLSFKTGLNVTLPTEVQWQRAAQGDDGRQYPWGNTFDKNKCNTSESGVGKTTPVNQYPTGASVYGVMDMSGNVWEWCLNEYANPELINIDSNNSRSLRGGSWYYNADDARAASRNSLNPASRNFILGFRVACSAPVP